LNFDGINDFVNAGNGTSLKINRGTIEAWIKTGNAGSQYRAIVCKQYAFGLFLNNNVLVAYDWNNLNQISTGINLADNSWHHVALSFDAGPNVHTANIYIDSILRAQANFYISNQNDSSQANWATFFAVPYAAARALDCGVWQSHDHDR
jgi:hypothetical protein